MGDTTPLPLDGSGGGNPISLVASSVSLSQPGTLQSLSFYVTTAAGDLRLGIYDATGPSGGPGALKAQTASFTPTPGWNLQSVITPVSLTPGTYWLAFLASSSSLGFKWNTDSGNYRGYTYTFGALPATFSTTPTSSGTAHFSLYATLTPSSSFAACNTVTTSNFSQSAYTAYGAPYDVFAANAPLVDAQCTPSDTHTINATLGKVGDTTHIVYTKGYYYDTVLANWTQYTATCNGTLNGQWCQGNATATITSPNLSTASAASPAYFVGMVCSSQGGAWKCGCRDTTCSQFYWMVEGAGM
jgi:hypothetical protein